MLASLVQLVRLDPAVALTQSVLRLVETIPVASVLTVLTAAVYWVGRMVGGALATRPSMVRQSIVFLFWKTTQAIILPSDRRTVVLYYFLFQDQANQVPYHGPYQEPIK